MKINFGIIQIVLLILKLTDTVTWSWWVIMIPTIYMVFIFICWWVIFIISYQKNR
jgi:hypothetical protein